MESMKDFEKELEESYKQFDENAFEETETEDDEIWVGLMEKMQSKEAFSVKVKEAVKGGVVAYVDEKRAFIPASQLSDTYVEKLEDFVGQHVTVIITEVDKEKERIILSAKALLTEKKENQKRQAQSKLKVGELYTGKVESLQPYGAFIDLGDGVSGLLHVSQISERRISSPKEVLKVGQEVKVKLIKSENGKLSLSMLDIEDSNWRENAPQETESLSTSLGSLLKGIKLD